MYIRPLCARFVAQFHSDGYRRNYNGVAEMHDLDLDFGSAARSNRAVLALNGWVDWADGSTFLGAAQEKMEIWFCPTFR